MSRQLIPAFRRNDEKVPHSAVAALDREGIGIRSAAVAHEPRARRCAGKGGLGFGASEGAVVPAVVHAQLRCAMVESSHPGDATNSRFPRCRIAERIEKMSSISDFDRPTVFMHSRSSLYMPAA
eukprot:Opistho-2@58698